MAKSNAAPTTVCPGGHEISLLWAKTTPPTKCPVTICQRPLTWAKKGASK